jgi:hypothetical protein
VDHQLEKAIRVERLGAGVTLLRGQYGADSATRLLAGLTGSREESWTRDGPEGLIWRQRPRREACRLIEEMFF